MIVEALLTVLFSVVTLIVSLFNFPAMPTSLVTAWESIKAMLAEGMGFIWFVFDPDVLLIVLNLILTLIVLEKAIDLVLWIWRTVHGEVGKETG